MAKRGTLNHRRTRRLARALGLPQYAAMGLMEAVWHVTAERTPRGDVGHMSDEDLAEEVLWERDPAELVAALLAAGVLETHPEYRLAVHGWSEHADNAIRHKLARAHQTFWDGRPPYKTKPAKEPLESGHDQTASDHDANGAEPDHIQPAENLPARASDQRPEPASRASDQPPTDYAPPGPPTPVENSEGSNGTNGARTWRVGDVLRDGREVLEVDENGPTVVRKLSRRDVDAALGRIVDVIAMVGPPADGAARAKIRERLRAGESEDQVKAPYWARLERMASDDAAEAQELDQAMRLLDGQARAPAAQAAPAPADGVGGAGE